jgi:hypothetical protein
MESDPPDSGESREHKRPLPDYPDLTLQQLFLFSEIMKTGQQVEVAGRYSDLSASKLSKDIKALKQQLNLANIPDRDFWTSIEAKALDAAIKPLMEACNKFAANDHERTLCIGSGGSILGWWLGKRSELIRDTCSRKLGFAVPSVYHVRLACRPMTNREIFSSVADGLLDLGIVRKSLLTHARAAHKDFGTVGSMPLGCVSYGIAVPDKLRKSWGKTNWSTTDEGYLTEELSILNSGFFASVGPEGEFKEQLYRSLVDANIDIRIEFSYRSFPQIIPHLIEGTHFGLCPILHEWGAHIPDCKIYPLKLMSHYKREVVLIWNKNLLKHWIDVEEIAEHLRWPAKPESNPEAGS